MFGGRVCTGRVWAVGVDGTVSRRDLSGRAAPIPLSRALRCARSVSTGRGGGDHDVIMIIFGIAGVSA